MFCNMHMHHCIKMEIITVTIKYENGIEVQNILATILLAGSLVIDLCVSESKHINGIHMDEPIGLLDL